MKRLRRLARRDDAQAWARLLAHKSLAAMARAEEMLREADDGTVEGGHRAEMLELCIAEAAECEEIAYRILQSGEPSLAVAFA